MKKWLILQSNLKFGPYGSTDCEFLRECYSLKFAIEQNGDKADIWGLRHTNFESKPNFNDYDYIFMEEQYEFDWVPWEEIRNSSACKLQLIGEFHQHNQFFKWINLFDVIMHPIKSIIEERQKQYPYKKHIWYPSSMDSRYYTGQGLDINKMIDSVWLGTSSRRYVPELVKEIGLKTWYKSGWEYIQTLSLSKVGLNSRGSIDINYKNFEIPGAGTCLVTNYDPAIEELGFKDDVNCLFYSSYDECKDKILYALKNENWKRLAISGFEFSKTQNYEKRIYRLKRILDGKINGIDYE